MRAESKQLYACEVCCCLWFISGSPSFRLKMAFNYPVASAPNFRYAWNCLLSALLSQYTIFMLNEEIRAPVFSFVNYHTSISIHSMIRKAIGLFNSDK